MNCKKHSQPQSAVNGTVDMLEKKIGDASDVSEQNISIEKQLILLMNETDSLLSSKAINDLDDFSIDLESEITKISAALFMENDPVIIFDTIGNLLFEKMKIRFEKDENDLDAIFPQKIIRSRRGTCLGISLLVLQICEKLGFPVYGVLVPGHFFVRYDDGELRRNFEPLRHGENMSEQWYREKWPTRDTVRYSLRNCTRKEVIGVVNYVIGNSLLAKDKPRNALQFYSRVQEKYPQLIEANGNAAIAYDKLGQTDKAIAVLSEMAKKYPTMNGIHGRYASLLLKKGQYADAESEFIIALSSEPESVSLHYGYATTLFSLKKCKEASETINSIISSKPDYAAAQTLKVQIDQQCGQ
jgi:regulator of sirC expression with transglutaminase-like and TPR domain